MQEWVTVIQNIGFPAAVAVAMFIMLQQEQKNHKEESKKLTETITDMKITFNQAIAEQDKNFTQAITNNTLVIQKLLDKMEDKQ